ncbi:16S rRNA (cytosine(1402)-N(4))-methyltransferase RsmH [Blastochloris sulfoviridis]|uniref:Ribosomal RNA small subunit methyltransferase H n=1 Tax=Blastochloris sulfoviridis TaxID=50712 RepID=A0A5M6HQJ3_9HYPH|nr:16S rRNA (cytosine(1402)-N(4))-methyltransferase RsmH [Blastochloris sulfoviridis]KAA5598100.1 16S rRNA (cytosine(1402)-N(4))-methyltransferase RsmH [Blastochloris sulfoviridis]
MAGGGPDERSAGGPARHIPVLVGEVLAALAPQDGDVIIDGTFGAGGYSRAILAAADCRVVAIDRDRTAILAGWDLVNAADGRLTLVEDRFSRLDAVAADLGFAQVDGVVLDIGVSSMQLDEAGRGFSFRADAPLDMRMASEGESAAELIARLDETTLANVIFAFGEERHSRAVARAIVAARAEAPIATTRQLADIVARVVRARPGDIHPATRTFQALRIAVNDELDELATALLAAERVLKDGGRLVVVSFHSLEDRIVKTFLAERSRTTAGGSRHAPQGAVAPATFSLAVKKPVEASAAEVAINPRARSAKLRAAIRTAAPARSEAPAPGWVPDPFAATGRRR